MGAATRKASPTWRSVLFSWRLSGGTQGSPTNASRGNFYRKCEDIFAKADLYKTGSLSVERLLVTARNIWLYIAGVKQSDLKLISNYSLHFGNGSFLYDIISVKQIPETVLPEVRESIERLNIAGEVVCA